MSSTDTEEVYEMPLKSEENVVVSGNLPKEATTLVQALSIDESSTDFEGPESSDADFSDSDMSEHRSGNQKASQYQGLTDTQSACLNFAMEHRIFLKAILGLLADRDIKATEIGMNDPNTLKSGPLKKASHLVKGVWKVKFVELRRGMFTYYEDALSGHKQEGSLLRKNLPLDSNNCSCRAVKILRNGLNMTVTGSIFELIVGNTRRLWLAKSNTERRAWIEAINDAMVGGSVTQSSKKEQHGRHGSVKSKSPFKKDLKEYLKVQASLKQAKSKVEYVPVIAELLEYPLEIPVQWIMQQMEKPNDDMGAFYEGALSTGIDQLWRDLQRDSILINSELFKGDIGHGPEKILGALARNIVKVSRDTTSGNSTRHAIPENKAFAYARDILLSVNRTRSGGDSYYCINTLCNNPNLVVITPSAREAEPLSLSVELDDVDDSTGYSGIDKSGWCRTRNTLQMSWRKRFFVLSEGTLSFYKNALPRPHGLRGQMVVTDATISVDRAKERSDYFVLSIEAKDGLKNRFLYFHNEDKLLAWAYALELVAKGSSLSSPNKRLFGKRKTSNDATEENNPAIMIEEAMKGHVERLGLDIGDGGIEERIVRLSAKASSRLKISVQASSEFKICTTDPQGDDGDTWAIMSTTFLQTFRISGDRILRGEETVRFQVTDCQDVIDIDENPDSADKAAPPRKWIRRHRRKSKERI